MHRACFRLAKHMDVPLDPGVKARNLGTYDTARLAADIRRLKSEKLTDEVVRKEILRIPDVPPRKPSWLLAPSRKVDDLTGVPSILMSDWHWGEVVSPKEIGGVNEFNLKIAHERARTLVQVSLDLLFNHISTPKYPGIVVNLGGDMVSGDIHEELRETNEVNSMPTLLDVWGVLEWVLRAYLERFPHVHVVCVTGNHGRTTHKPRMKRRNHTNFDWLLYQCLARSFSGVKNITFDIPDGPDALYKVYGTRYLLTHGDQFRGGDGIIGAIGPLTRGNQKKQSRNQAVGMDYDVMLCGHWHQYIHLSRLICNGCFPKGSLVVTPNGYQSIETIKVGDPVLSRDGSIQRVTNLFQKTADTLVGIKVRGLPVIVESTPNHLVWAIKASSRQSEVPPSRRKTISKLHGIRQWIPMDYLSPGDYVHVPFPKGEDAPVDEETAWAYGLFLAEGSALLDGGRTKRHNRIALTMHIRERKIVERWARWFEKTFGKTPRIYERAWRSTCELAVSVPRDTSLWFRETFGHGAHNMHLPDGALLWADHLKAALLDGWITGDGHSAAQEDCRPTISATSVSQRLAVGMFLIAPASSLWPSLSVLPKGGPRKSDTYTVHFNSGQEVLVEGGEAFYRIAERFEQHGTFPVHDLEVAGEHTYCVGGIGVHNSLKGYDEYANQNNFGFEQPQQALWITHPKHGITYRMPVFVSRHKGPVEPAPWVSVAKR